MTFLHCNRDNFVMLLRPRYARCNQLIRNVIAYYHAYKLTHYSREAKFRTLKVKKLTRWQKLSTLIFGISNPRPKNDKKPIVPYKTVKIKSNYHLESWYINTPKSRGTVILFHGYGGNKSGLIPEAQAFNTIGFNTLLVDSLSPLRED